MTKDIVKLSALVLFYTAITFTKVTAYSKLDLVYAVAGNNEESVKRILNSNPGLLEKNLGFGRNALQMAAMYHNYEVVVLLVNQYIANVKAKDSFGQTALELAGIGASSDPEELNRTKTIKFLTDVVAALAQQEKGCNSKVPEVEK